jgi:hypothetical protein
MVCHDYLLRLLFMPAIRVTSVLKIPATSQAHASIPKFNSAAGLAGDM